MKVLGIETSCDETAVAIIDDKKNIISHIVLSQLEDHIPYGGVVPEIASRCHIKHLKDLIKKCFQQASLTINDVDAIAVTGGPGLIGGVLVGVMVAKGMAAASGKPFIAINHLEGHALTIRLTEEIDFPYLMLLVSGGHCQILQTNSVGNYIKFGGTIDDAVGESFDKVAKMLNIPYPGGPKIEQLAKEGDCKRFKFPRPLLDKPASCDFSFSGLKTAVKRQIDKMEKISDQDKKDICASFQKTVADIIVNRLNHAARLYPNDIKKQLVIAGGVAANQFIKERIKEALPDFSIHSPPISLCTDNAAMIAWAGVEKLKLGQTNDLSFSPKSRWPLYQ